MNQFGASLRVRNVNEALPVALQMIQEYGKPAESRGLHTLRVHGPVTTIYERPEERVLFDSVRDANPFFHLIESLWILGGSNRMELPSMFLEGIKRFSDDGVTFHGATWVRRIGEGEATIYEMGSGKERHIAADAVVLATGRQTQGGLAAELEGKVAQVFTVGDAMAIRFWAASTFEAQKFARLIGEEGAPTTTGEAWFAADDPAIYPVPAA